MFNVSSFRVIGTVSIILGVFCNASAGVFARIINQNGDINLIISSMYRFFISVPFILAFLIVTKHKFSRFEVKDICLILLGGVLFGLGVVAYNTSFLYTTIANANLFSNLLPFAVVPLSALIFGEKISFEFILAVFITVFGIVLLVCDFSQLGGQASGMLGNIIALSSTIIYALYLVNISGLRKKFVTSELMLYMSFFAGVSILIYALIVGDTIIPSETSTIYSLFGLSLITHLLGAVVIAFGAGFVSASVSSVLIMLQPIAGIVYGFFFYSEILSLQEFIGMVIAIVGVVYAQNSAVKSEKSEK